MPVAHQLFCSGADPLRHPRRPLHLSNKPRVAYLLNTRQQRQLLRHRSLPLRPHAATEASQSSASNPSGASPSALSSATEQLLAELRAGQPLQQSLGSVGRPLGPSAAAAGEAVSSAFEVTDAASASALGYYKQAVQQERLGMQQQLRQRQQQQQGSGWDWGDYEQMAREWREQQQQEKAAGYRQQQQAWQEHGQQQAPAVAGALPGTFVRPALHMPAGPAEHAAAASGPSMQSIAVPPPGSLSAAVPYPPDRGGGYPGSGASARFFLLGALAAVAANYMMGFVNTLPVVQYFVRRFIWWADPAPRGESATPGDTAALTVQGAGGALMQFSDDGESVEWVNMCWRKMWRVYQRGIERWLADLLQPLFDQLVREGVVPRFVQRLRILEFTLDHEAPYFTNMRRRTSRKDSDLTGVVDIRYTGGARMVLLIEVGFGKWRVKVPVLVSDLDLECKMWLKLRLAPLPPYIGAVSLGFLSPPMIKVQLSPYGKVQLMRIPIIQAFLRKFFTVQLPGLIVLPKRLDINIPPSTTAVAEAAIGRDAVMRAVASAVLQADALEHALMAALPLGPQGAAGGVSLPESFRGELSVTLHEAKELPVWGFPWQSNPYCRMSLGNQAVQSRRDVDTSHKGRHREPVWNQEFQFLVEDPATQTLEIWVRDSPVTGRREVGYATFPLRTLPQEGTLDLWLPVESSMPGEPNQGMIHLGLSYKSFADDEGDSGYREAQAFAKIMQEQAQGIVDVKSAADASSRAAVAASAAATAVAVTKAAAARAATRLAKTASRGRRASGSDGEGSEGSAASGSDSEGSDSDSNGSNGSSQPPAASSDSEGTQAAAGKEGSKGASGSGSKDGEGQGTASGTNGATNGTPAMGGVDLGTLAKAITQTLEKATLEEQQQLDRKRAAEGNGNGSGSGKEASSGAGAGAGAGVGADAGKDGDANGAGPKAETDSAALARLQEITSAMHDMKLEVDQLVYTPKRHKIHDGRLPPEEAAAGAAAEPPPDPSELFKAASEIAESAVAVAGAAAVAAAPAVDDLAAVPSGTDVRAVGAGVAPRQKWDPDAEPASEEEREKYKVEKMEKAVKKAVDAKATEAAQKVTALELGAGLDEVEGEAVAVVAQRPDGWRQRLAAWGAGLNSGGKSTKTKGRGQADDNKAKKAEEKARDKAVADAAAQEAVAGLPEPIAAVELADGPDGPVSNVVLPPDLPLDVIAEEVQRGWKNKEVHVEGLLKKAMEERQKEGEGRWLVVLTVTSGACAVLLSIVLYRMMHMQ